ncbi:hypothetical protein XM38_043740 [Halomicronema hongdechloris C2206]|uniref:DUF6444 domain-containing protein n=1 Tax=Halomicronema hongdechloris C2206 TaxID=1641165 RepID=A0A1Z3HTG0_9CYAN|nr:DUF6444 domain-containing protein [Halomicronema hongdechloris]ASC73407.1 hypothetical protein XM38_043740 [Halomicronema hongdechloris C2206]
MSETITIAGIEIPKADWDATPASVQAVVMVLSERLAHIEEQLKQNSRNSSRPPSSDTLSQRQAKPEEPSSSKRRESKRSQGAQGKKGHRGPAKGFGFYPVEAAHLLSVGVI